MRAAGRRLGKIGLQLYTVRRQLAADFDGTLGRVAALGFREVEFAGYHGLAPAQVKSALQRYRLSSPSAHVTTAELRGGLEKAIEAALLVGHRYLACGYVPAEERRSLDDYRRLADLLNRAGGRGASAYSSATTTTISSSRVWEGKSLTTCCSRARTRGS